MDVSMSVNVSPEALFAGGAVICASMGACLWVIGRLPYAIYRALVRDWSK